jgi:hypothetical protein
LTAEREVHTGEIFEIVLRTGVAGAVDAETGVKVGDFNRTRLDALGEGDVQPAPNYMARALLLLPAKLADVVG